MEATIITLLVTLIVITFGGFWRVRTDIADVKADIARIDTKLDTHTERTVTSAKQCLNCFCYVLDCIYEPKAHV